MTFNNSLDCPERRSDKCSKLYGMSRIKFDFKGLMAPVFTAFHDDEERSIDLSIIDSYAEYLKQKSVLGVLVNGTTGEGPSLSVSERKTVTEEWAKACMKHGLTLMVQIGGAPLCDVIELAKHAEALKVDSILCLPELYFKPKTINDLVIYLKEVASHCPSIPFLFYYIPMFTEMKLHMPTFCRQAEEEIPNFIGLKYTSGDLDQGSACLHEGRCVFLGADTILSGALVLGFDSAIMTTLNIFPEVSIEIMNCIQNNSIDGARRAQQELTERICEILKVGGGEWVPSMKQAFNHTTPLNAGPVRTPGVKYYPR